VDRKGFGWLVAKALDALPEEFIARLENVTVVIEDQPTHYQLTKARLKHSQTLLGLYEGVPLTRRGSHYGLGAKLFDWIHNQNRRLLLL